MHVGPHIRAIAGGGVVAGLLLFGAATTSSQPPRPESSPINLGVATAPKAEFKPLFDGRSLAGWKGLVADPVKRATMNRSELSAAQAKADESMRQHWKVENGALRFDGKGESLCTTADYANFELFVDWKIPKGGDSGIYLRGAPQVQIWDNPLGSGGLYNNQKNAKDPIVVADRPVGEWNTFHIIMIADRVTVWLNGKCVVENTLLENYWERDKPIYPTGQIELQNHGGELWFRNLWIRELPKTQ